jgi:ubiquinone/menaquinone biosynthesis C-methylase UbiE
MAFHTYPIERADDLEDESRYRYCSREELIELLGVADRDEPTVVDLGSGTGFYTDDVAPFVDRLVALDVQSAMHERYEDKGIPATVTPVTGTVDGLPVGDDAVDVAYSTMTYHEYATLDTLAEIERILDPDGRHVVVDWSAEGSGDAGPPVEERFSADEAIAHHEEAGFAVEDCRRRPETFVLLTAVAR